MSKKNRIEDFRYKMKQDCEQQSNCEYCKWYYVEKDGQRRYRRCFNKNLVDYMTYQEERHG